MDQLERNIVESFNLVKHDINMLKAQVQHIAEIQEKLALNLTTLEHKQKPVVQKVVEKKVVVEAKHARKKTHYVSSKTSNKFHKENCPFAQNIKPKMKVRYMSKVKALNEGLKPCKCITK